MEIVRSVNKSWIYMTLSSAYIELFIRGKSPGLKCPGGNVRIPIKHMNRRNAVADRPQGLNEGLLINIDVLQCMVSYLIDVQ